MMGDVKSRGQCSWLKLCTVNCWASVSSYHPFPHSDIKSLEGFHSEKLM